MMVETFEHQLMKVDCVEIDDKKAKDLYENMPEINTGLGRPYDNAMPPPSPHKGRSNNHADA